MPELPEVETIARGVDARVRGDRVTEVWLGSKKEPFKTAPARMATGLEGRTLLSVRRVGKHIVAALGTAHGGPLEESRAEAEWIVHLGMTGRLLVTTPGAEVAPHTHARLTLASGREVRFVDPRRFGRLELRELVLRELELRELGTREPGRRERKRDRGLAAPFSAPGAEPLTIDSDAFAALFKGRKLAIKAALLNQTLLAGVGNIYADEGLFRAGIRPKRQAGRLGRTELERLRLALREVLEHAIQLGGSSVSDYVDANGVKGFFQLEHRVYQRTGEPCRVCGEAVRRIVVAGRSTHFCAHCQK